MTAESPRATPDPSRKPGEADDAAVSPTDVVEAASKESFPASDPPAWTPVEGEKIPAPPPSGPTEGEAKPADDGSVSPLEAELAALKDRLLRALAEQENIRRRAARERDEAVRFAASNLARDLLPSLDNLRRALDSIPADGSTKLDETTQKLLAGVAATERAMFEALGKHGVSRIDPAPGDAFDPQVHQAMFEVKDSAHAPGTVAQVLQPAYTQHERLLRPALVGVAAGPDAANGNERSG